MSDYKLSASLQGHEDDVRSVAFPRPDMVLSASRDATVRMWKLLSQGPSTFDCTIASHGSSFINSLAYVPPSVEFPEGLVVSGGKDTVIEVRQPGKAPSDNADALLLGHESNVCALDVSEDGKWIVSGSWDCDARIWQVGKWDSVLTLQGHTASVWDVLAYDSNTVITACADRNIRIFDLSGKLRLTLQGGEDVVRALCKLPSNHPSGAHFASAGNDAVIRLWTLDGRLVAELHGHENFIYSLAALPDGGLVSSSEDRTARIWRGNECVQTITHPAISVWSVAVCRETGDIVTGTSDRTVRVFTREAARQADPATISAFEESVKQSSIPAQQLGGVNKEKLPGPDFLKQKSGTKEGQVQMISEPNGSITAYQWSAAAHEWVQIGTVVDSVGSSGRKITHDGKDYDYVFDVDIEEGKPPLKLPYNLSQNPYEVARKFIEDHELPISYLDQVTNFIISNTQGATLGQSAPTHTQAPGSDPWGSESRYRPGEIGSASSAQPETARASKILPQTQYLSISTANIKTILKKLEEFNSQLIEEGSKDVSLNPTDVQVLTATGRQLESTSNNPTASTPVSPDGIDIVLKIITHWPQAKRLPGFDLLRLLTGASDTTVSHTSSGPNTLIDILASTGVFSRDAPPNQTMLAVRAIANLFNTESGRTLADGTFDQIHSLVHPLLAFDPTYSHRNLLIAITTLYINFSVQLTAPAHNADRALTLLQDLSTIIRRSSDSEALYRALVAAGTLLALGEDFRDAAKEVFEFKPLIAEAQTKGKEPRIKNVVREIEDELDR